MVVSVINESGEGILELAVGVLVEVGSKGVARVHTTAVIGTSVTRRIIQSILKNILFE